MLPGEEGCSAGHQSAGQARAALLAGLHHISYVSPADVLVWPASAQLLAQLLLQQLGLLG